MGKAAVVRAAGLCTSLAYGAAVGWVYARQPQTVAQITGGLASTVGAYRIDQPSFLEGVRHFRAERYEEARSAWARADPAKQDPATQFWIAYSFYRQGWGRLYHDDALYKQGLEAVERAIKASPDGRVVVNEPDLGMRTADELQAELRRGLTREPSDYNPMRVLEKRK